MNKKTYWDLYPKIITNNELKRKKIPMIRKKGKRKWKNYKVNKKITLPFE